jgi:L-threonylcarbamoyladenylate synthase
MAVVEASNAAIEAAAQALRGGKLVAFPTETVYGLGADATNGLAVAAIFAAKGRPRFNPLIVHVPDIDAAARLGDPGDLGGQLAAAFWPGALSLVMRKRPDCAVADLATAGLETIALRVPRHAVAQALLRAAGRPIAAPSANLSGRVSPTTAAHVEADLGSCVAMVLDGGATSVGLESTVVDVTGDEPIVLRLGGVGRDELARVLGCPLAVARGDPSKPASPGMLERHYAPATKLRLDADAAGDGEALLAFGGPVPRHAGPTINLSTSGDLAEAAANLFAALRTLDASGAGSIAVMPIPNEGLGEAINDRLRRAARMP